MREPETTKAEPPDDTASSAPATSAPATTPSPAGRFFGAPLLAILLVGAVAMVVVGFGRIATGGGRSIESLLTTLEAGGGERNALGMLASQDKEYWRAAQELARRLEREDAELSAEHRAQAAERLANMISTADVSGLGEQGRAAHQFLMMALGRLGDARAIDVLAGQLSASGAGIRRVAAQALADLRHVDGVDRVVPDLTRLVGDPDQAVRMVACNVLGQVARANDVEAVAALAAALTDDREVQWNAALALGHLGSEKAAIHLASMLERSFWEGVGGKYETAEGSRERPPAPTAVRMYLIAAMRSASCLDDDRLNALIACLREDEDLQVRQAARELTARLREPAA